MGIPRNSPCPCGSGKKYKHCCFQKDFIEVPAKRKEVKFKMPGEGILSKQIVNLDSIPTHNKNGIKPNITKYQMMDLCLDEIYNYLKNENVGMLVDLVNNVISEMDIVPSFTYREIAEQMDQDKRFSIYEKQICALRGKDPLELIAGKIL